MRANTNGADAPDGPCDHDATARGSFGALCRQIFNENSEMTSTQPTAATTADQDPCPSCGARLGGRGGCQATFEQLVSDAWTSPGRGSVHNLVVDAYAVQHSEDYGRSAKSYIAHLIAL